MVKIKLPLWLNRGQAKALGDFYQSWWEHVKTMLTFPYTQLDPETCHLSVLALLAWQRHVEKVKGESERIYRLRVKHAFENARDAGSTAGLKRIFQRLEIGHVDVVERDPNKDWDIIILEINDSQLSRNQELLKRLLKKYGRTCRRYEFRLITPIGQGIDATSFDHLWGYSEAR